jgi:hypothetical protein
MVGPRPVLRMSSYVVADCIVFAVAIFLITCAFIQGRLREGILFVVQRSWLAWSRAMEVHR